MMFDATYKLIGLRIPVYLLLVVDGDGLSKIVDFFVLSDETKTVIESIVNVFKKYNEAWSNIPVMLSDKYFNERDM